jgi:hypothetical protein
MQIGLCTSPEQMAASSYGFCLNSWPLRASSSLAMKKVPLQTPLYESKEVKEVMYESKG